MHNKVVTMAARALRELGITVVRFNFRSVGNSAGTFDHGDGEQDDLRAVADWVRTQRPGDTVWLGGFSFGAYVSLRAAGSIAPQVLISIAPPAGRWDFSDMQPPAQWLVIQAMPMRSSNRKRSTTGWTPWNSPPSWCACPTPAISSTAN